MKKGYWFKRRRYGWGWIPVSWQGWLVVGVYLGVVIAGASAVSDASEGSFPAEGWFYLMFLAVATVALLRISRLKGPKPKWRWGHRPTDNPDEDW